MKDGCDRSLNSADSYVVYVGVEKSGVKDLCVWLGGSCNVVSLINTALSAKSRAGVCGGEIEGRGVANRVVTRRIGDRERESESGRDGRAGQGRQIV